MCCQALRWPESCTGWQRWMVNQVERADYVLVVCSEKYQRRFRGEDRLPDASPVLLVRERELDDDAHAAHERLVHVLPKVCR